MNQPCEATTSISGRNPVDLNVDQTYEAIALNKQPNPTHAYIKVPDVGSRWVALSCGQLSNTIITANTPQPVSRPTNTVSSRFLPFFDNINNPVNVKVGGRKDLTPLPPQLNDFDKAMNQICGEVGTVVSPDSFKEKLREFPDVLTNIRETVGNSLVDGRTADDDFIDDLTDIWFNAHGFDHVFCGEPGQNNIGGLHFVGRYLDLQQKGVAGRLPNADNRAEVEDGAIYTLGVEMKVGDRIVKAPIKGYGYTLNAEDILAIAAKAYKDNPNTESTSKGCTLTITDDGKTFANVFVAKNGAIRTFFPDATPDFNRNGECNS
ncbi:EndoU domain-containing protein [Nostoc sp. TCL26-01]|uniref:EndoU domain-containing protein n=1 Tax=Nostoc sp. TCL26-01 TaxID=2576904 RepID=UPI001C4ABEA2|nr:EndoU domain-containing protein [Nostoc sp. TCL26-01]